MDQVIKRQLTYNTDNLQSVWARGRFSIRFSPASFSSLSACSFRLVAASTELSSMSRTSVTGSRSVIGRISVWRSFSLSRSVTTLRQCDAKEVTLRMISDLVWSSQSKKIFPLAKKFQLKGETLFPTPILLWTSNQKKVTLDIKFNSHWMLINFFSLDCMSASFSVASYIPHWLLAGSQSHSERHLEIVIKGYKPQVTVYVPKNNFPKSSSNKNFTTWCSELFPLIDWRTQVFLQSR